MANVNQTLASNFVADPKVMSPVNQLHGRMRVACGTIALAAGDLSASDTVMLCPVPTGASVVSIKLFNTTLTPVRPTPATLVCSRRMET